MKGSLQPLHHQAQPQNVFKFIPTTLNNASPQSRIPVPGAMLVPLLSANVFAMNERKAVGKIYAFFCFDKSIEQKYDYYLLAVFGLKKGSLSSSFAESELLRIFREKHEDLDK